MLVLCTAPEAHPRRLAKRWSAGFLLEKVAGGRM